MNIRVSLTIVVLFVLTAWTAAHAKTQQTSFSDSAGEHVIYIGYDEHVHEIVCGSNCFSTSNWTNQDLTGAGLVGGYPLGPLTSFADTAGEHVFLVETPQGSTRDIHHLFWNGTNWSDEDLNVHPGVWGTFNSYLGSASLTGYGGADLCGPRLCLDRYGERLYYETSDQHIHVLTSSDSTNWSDLDLTFLTGGTLAAMATSLTSFIDSSGEHLAYQATNGDIHQLYGHWTTQGCSFLPCFYHEVFTWVDQQLTGVASGSPLMRTPLTSFSDSSGPHLYYFDINMHVNQLFWQFNSWNNTNTALQTSGVYVAAAPYSGLSSFSDSFGPHVYYVGADEHLYHLWGAGISNSWLDQDLTSTASGLPSANILECSIVSHAIYAHKAESAYYVSDDDDKVHWLFNLGTASSFLDYYFGWTDLTLPSGDLSHLSGPYRTCY